MTDSVEPLLTLEMFASDEEFWNALIGMARTGQVGPVEPAPPRPPLGPICRRALAQLGLDFLTPTQSTHRAEEDGAANSAEAAHVPRNARTRAWDAGTAKLSSITTTTRNLLPHCRRS
jgi:hypothetical protein